MTLTPASPAGLEIQPNYESRRQALNRLLREDHAFADAVVDIAGDSRIGDAGDEADPQFFVDRLHLTKFGYRTVAGLVQASIRSLLR